MKLFWGLLLFAALPATTNYQLNSYGFGSGGTANATTSTYALEGTTGEVSGANSSTTNYTAKPGYIESQQAQVPKVSSIDNGGGTYYNKLHFVIDGQGNPTDSLYAISVSTDNFVADTRYVKSDMTVGASLATTDYQTYALYGGSSGASIIGLTPSTTYYVRIKATQGKFTESAYGPTASATTAGSNLSFSVSTNSVALGNLLPGTVVSGVPTVSVSFATNATSGGDVYISGLHTGLLSARAGQTIPSATGDLSALSRGYGAQVSAISATSGTFSKLSPYDGTANNVGITDSTIRRIMTASGPVVGGSGTVIFKARSATSDTADTDYTETNTMLASGNF